MNIDEIARDLAGEIQLAILDPIANYNRSKSTEIIKETLMQFAAALDELSQEIKQKVKESVDE